MLIKNIPKKRIVKISALLEKMHFQQFIICDVKYQE